MKKLLALLFILPIGGCFLSKKEYSPPLKMVVAVPVANVRSEPIPHNGLYEFDPRQETQVEKGEPVYVYQKKGDWIRIGAPEQLEFTHHSKWEPYPGWVEKSALTDDLSLHHRLQRDQDSTENLRKKLLEKAQMHFGNPYLWGGRSLHNPELTDVATGVDCSGLVNWSFRQLGWFVARDAHEQYLKSRPVDPIHLKPGDLIFLAKVEDTNRVVHVGFYFGKNKILEAPSSGEKVRIISLVDRFGLPLEKINNGQVVGDRVIYFGSLFPEEFN